MVYLGNMRKNEAGRVHRTQIIRSLLCLAKGLDFEGSSEPLQDFKEGADLIRSL